MSGRDPGPPAEILARAPIQALRDLAEHPNVRPGAVLDIVRAFLADSVDHLQAIEAALRTHDLDQIASQSHTLRGAGGSVGAARLSALCGELELAAGHGDAVRTRALARGLADAFADARAALEHEFGLDAGHDTDPDPEQTR